MSDITDQVRRGLILIKGHFDDGGHNWLDGTEMEDVSAALAWIEKLKVENSAWVEWRVDTLKVEDNSEIEGAVDKDLVEYGPFWAAFDEEQFDCDSIDARVAHLLINDVLMIGGEEATLNVVCSDTFYYASADCEPISSGEIHELYKLWRADPMWGPTWWCVKKRNMRPLAKYQKVLGELGYPVDEVGK